ncbi:aminotransferase class I/II-fold pyridoxal phosphate-dependent enzyme [bacterium]|nr:aminotransferase class I/II-fold pyridoxal phosphate-dependent enzyme [bacterium]
MINTLRKKNRKTLFTTPSHSQTFSIFSKLKQFYKYDISELDCYDIEKSLRNAEVQAAKIYKTKSTHFLTNGSTSGIIAAVLTCVKPDDKVLIWKSAHRCHKNAVILAGAIPVFYELEKDEEWGIYKEFTVDKLQNDIKAVIVTSPSYYGIVSDIRAIKQACPNAYIIVDEAHGALYPFGIMESAIYQGADFVIQSLHKTAGGLNPTALLHNNSNLDASLALDMITTTSPSYPILASIQQNIRFLNSQRGRKNIKLLLKNIDTLKKNIKTVDFLQTNDPTKVVIKKHGMTGYELSEFLYKNGIEDEKTNEKSTMLLCGIGTDIRKLNRLEKVLKKL